MPNQSLTQAEQHGQLSSSSQYSASPSPAASNSQNDDDSYSDYMASELDNKSVAEGGSEAGGRSPSPAPSVYSYSSSVDAQLILRDAFGRVINNVSDFYMMPADAVEHGRLDLQHEMLKRRMNGVVLKPDAVKRALAPNQSVQPAALDVGTGSGFWVIDMAKQFPHAEIVGLDLAPANLSTPPPANSRFECDDINLGLLHYYNSFNVVHVRCVSTGIIRYREFLDEVVEILRPGGVFLAVDGDMQLYNENFAPVEGTKEGEQDFTWMQKMLATALSAAMARSDSTDAYYHIPDWLKEMDAWSETGSKFYFIPVGPWEENTSDKDKYIAELMRQDMYRLIGALRPLLLSHGYFADTVDGWIKNIQHELAHLEKKMYVKWHCSWAIKKKPERTEQSSSTTPAF